MFDHGGIDVESLIGRKMWLSISHRAVSLVVLTILPRKNDKICKLIIQLPRIIEYRMI